MNYLNNDNILTTNLPISGKISENVVSTRFVSFDETDDLSLIINIFTLRGDFLHQADKVNYKIVDGNLAVDMKSIFETFNILNGSYRMGISVVKLLSLTKILELSPDRTEIKIAKVIFNSNDLSIRKNGYFFNINNYWSDSDFTYVKLSNEYSIEDFQNIYIVENLTDEIFDTVNIFKPLSFKESPKLKGPRFDIDVDSTNSEISVLKNWEDLLASDTQTSQEIIDSIFQVDNSVTLNIDWTFFENYIFYSRALERVENFHSKILMIEELNAKIADLDNIPGSEITNSQYSDSILKIVKSFDSFERYLYYIVDPKIFTHETLGPVRPWPKFIAVDGSTQLHPSNNQLVITWFTNLKTLATNYDTQNLKSLWYSIPEHILMNDANSEYILFVEMIGQHFDNIWLYMNALTDIHNKDEHPKRGPARELLTTIANSFGWKLENNRNLSDLWLYKLGKNSDGTDVSENNMLSHESQSEQTWRRIVNNLPALLKSKGTSRSIKSLMSIYGIPSTLISIKEYGGTSLNDEPIFIEDRYHYKLRLMSRIGIGFRTIDFELAKGQEFIEPKCNLNIFNGDFSRGLLDWGVQIINGGSYPEIDENLGSIDNANAIFCPSAGTILTKNLDLEKNKRYQIQFRVWRPNTPPPDDNTGRFQLEFNGENVLLYDGSNSYLNGGASDEDFVWTIYLVGDVENLLEIYTFDDNISFWEFKIEEVAFPERYPDTYEFRFQYHEFQGEDGDLFEISASNPLDIDYFNFVKFRLPIVGENKRKLIIFNEDNIYSEITLHESDEINFEPNEFYTFRLYRDLKDPTRFHYNLANSSNSLLGEINNEIFGSFTSLELLNENNNHVLTFKFIEGYIQGYKEYFGNYSYATFKEHVLNPASYSTDEYNGAYNKLFTYYPFGLDLQKFGHLSSSHPSSQPNRNFTSSVISMSGFSANQSLNYYNDSETYYIDSPMLGGRNIYSKKIRIDDNIIENAILNNNSRVKQSENYFNADTNKLAIVFSLADQINRDIFNHINGDDLNNSIGDPSDEFNDTYSNLDNLRRRYFKKYQTRNDINIFIRLLSAYDYSFFEQIKQLVPGSANLISGILIEPHILEKNKQIILKPIEISNENIEIDYNLDIQNESGEIELLETEVIHRTNLLSKFEYLKAILTRQIDLETIYSKLNTTIKLDNLINFNYSKMLSGPGVTIRPRGSGNLETIIENPRDNCKYLEKIYNYTSETRPEYSIYKYLDIDDGVSSANANGYEYADLDLILNLDKRTFARYLRFDDILLTGSGPITVSATFENLAFTPGKYVGRFFIEWLDGTSIVTDNARATIVMITSDFSAYSIPIGLKHGTSSEKRIINPYLIEIDVLNDVTATLTIELALLDGINCSSEFRIYGFDIYEDIGMYAKEMIMLDNQLNANYQFTSNKPSSYQIDEESSMNNKRFSGSKISSPGWNMPSSDTYDQSPVVTFNIVDSNILTVNPLQDSNLKVN